LLQSLLAREGEKPFGELRALFGRLDCRPDPLDRALVVPHQLLDKLEVAHDHHEQIVEVMGDAAGELTDGLHLLRLQEFLFEQLALGDALASPEDRLDAPARIAFRLDIALQVTGFAGVELDRDLKAGGLAAATSSFKPVAKALAAIFDHGFELGKAR